jgi:hypothetical protein
MCFKSLGGDISYHPYFPFHRYSKLSDVVDHFFPPLLDRVPKASHSKSKMLSGNFPAAQEYSTFTYWRSPLPDIADELPDFSKSAKGRKASIDVSAKEAEK